MPALREYSLSLISYEPRRLLWQVAEAAARRSDIAEALGACPQWPGWAASVLQPRNERDNLMHWACGRPSASDMHGAMAEDSPAGVLVLPLLLGSCEGPHPGLLLGPICCKRVPAACARHAPVNTHRRFASTCSPGPELQPWGCQS